MIQHLSERTMLRPLWTTQFLLVMSAIINALIAMAMGMSLYWLGLIPGQALLVGSAWVGVMACYLFPGHSSELSSRQIANRRFTGRMVILLCGFLLFLATGSRIAAKNTKELLSQKGYTTFTASGTATIPPTFLKVNYRQRNTKHKNVQHNLKHRLVVAVHIFRMYNEDLPRDLLIFLIVIGGITATGLSVLIASQPETDTGSNLFLAGASTAVFSQGVWAGAAILTIMVIKKLTHKT